MERVNFQVIEKKWQKDLSPKNFTILREEILLFRMFPYPSGKIHMGRKNYTIGDVLARYKFMKGLLFDPMGDAFGFTENASKQNNLHPKKWTKKNIETMKNQLKMLGLSIDWDLEISTCDPDYYKHQQESL